MRPDADVDHARDDHRGDEIENDFERLGDDADRATAPIALAEPLD